MEKNEIELILWDVDGTLFSSEGIIHQVYQDAFEKSRAQKGWPDHVPSLPEIMAQIGKPVREIFQNLTPELSQEQQDALSLRILHELVLRISQGEGEHYKGAKEVLHELSRRGYRFMAASNGRYPYIEAILRANQTFALFEAIDSVDHKNIHDKSGLVRHCLKKAGLPAHKAVLVGDRKSDRDAAINNQVPFIATAFGHGSHEEWEGAVAVISDLKELLELLPDRKHGNQK